MRGCLEIVVDEYKAENKTKFYLPVILYHEVFRTILFLLPSIKGMQYMQSIQYLQKALWPIHVSTS